MPEAKVTRLKSKIEKLQEEIVRLNAINTEMIESDISQGNVYLQLRSIRDPLTQTLRENHVVVGMSQDRGDTVIRVGLRGALGSGADHTIGHICPTSSGIS